MVTHSSIFSWRIPQIEEPGRPQVHRFAKSQTQLQRLSIHTHHKNVLCFSLNVSGGKTQDGRFCLLGREGLKLKQKHFLGLVRRRKWQPIPVLLPGKSHGRRSLVGCSPWGRTESDTTEQLPFHFALSCIGEGNGNPLQCSCLENPRDGGAWWAAVYGVAQSWTQLKRLSSSSSSEEKVSSIRLQKQPDAWWGELGILLLILG